MTQLLYYIINTFNILKYPLTLLKNNPLSRIIALFIGSIVLCAPMISCFDDNYDRYVSGWIVAKSCVKLIVESVKLGTVFIDSCQPTNPDIEKQHKNGYFRPIHPTLVAEDEINTLDIETTIYYYSNNKKGVSIRNIIHEGLKNRYNTLTEDYYQESYKITDEYLRRICIFVCNKRLDQLRQGLTSITNFLNSQENSDDALAKLSQQQEQDSKQKEQDRFIGIIRDHYPHAFLGESFVKYIGEKLTKEKKIQAKQEENNQKDDAMAKKKIY